MSKKKKLLLLGTTGIFVIGAGLCGGVLYLQANPESPFGQFLATHGVPVQAIVSHPQVAEAAQKLENIIPGLDAKARSPEEEKAIVSAAAFKAVTVKGVIGSAADGTALISAEGQIQQVQAGDQFSVKTSKGNVVMICEAIHPGVVVLSIANSNLRKEYALR